MKTGKQGIPKETKCTSEYTHMCFIDIYMHIYTYLYEHEYVKKK